MADLPRVIFSAARTDGESAHCPFCHDALQAGEEAVQCPDCGRWHHVACWAALDNHCSQFGCEGSGELGPLEQPVVAAPSLLDQIELTPLDEVLSESPGALLVDEVEILDVSPLADEESAIIDIDLPPAAPPPPPQPIYRPPPAPATVQCPFCQARIDQSRPVVACANCSTPHHLECWDEAAKCSTTGCNSRRHVPYTPAGANADRGANGGQTFFTFSPTPPAATPQGAPAVAQAIDIDIPQKNTWLSRLKRWWASKS